MSKFFIKLLLFLSPIIAWTLVVNFLLPIDFYYVRAWEALSPKKLTGVWPSAFYPSQYLDKVEKGDLGPHTKFAVEHRAIWQTDKYGMRNSVLRDDYDVVVLGDSTASGAGLSQAETLPSRVEALTGLSAYAYTGTGLADLLRDERFSGEHKPKIIIQTSMERMLPGMSLPEDLSLLKPVPLSIMAQLRLNSFFSHTAIFFDRAFDPTLFKFIKFKLTGQKSHFYTYEHDRILFIDGQSANDQVADESVKQTIAALTNYSQQLTALGYRFIFVPVPNKENIYYTMMPNQTKPVFLKKLIAGLKQAGVEVIDTQSSFDAEFKRRGPTMYHSDDTHWNGVGVDLAAREIVKLLKK
jgi:hypothetical protein